MSDFEAVDLRIISYIHEGLSIAAIAARIGVTSPRITQRLNRMRKLCGGDPLYYKEGGRYYLTETGEALLEFSVDVEVSWVKFKKQAAQIKSNHGQLRIIAIPSVLIHDTPPILDIVRKEFPHLRVKLITGSGNEILDSVAKGKADIGLIGVLKSAASLSISLYKTEKLVLLAPNSHPIAKHNSITFSQLERYTFIAMDHSNLMSDLMNIAIRQSQINPSFSITASDLESAAQIATTSTFGIAVTLESVALRYAKSNSGKVIYLTDSWANVEMNVCTRDRTTITDAQRLFIEELEKINKPKI